MRRKKSDSNVGCFGVFSIAHQQMLHLEKNIELTTTHTNCCPILSAKKPHISHRICNKDIPVAFTNT